MSRDERGGGGGRRGQSRESATAHKHGGIMEKRSPRRTWPSDLKGLPLLTSLLTLYGLTCELTASLSFLNPVKEVAVELLGASPVKLTNLTLVSHGFKTSKRHVFVALKWAALPSKPASFIQLYFS